MPGCSKCCSTRRESLEIVESLSGMGQPCSEGRLFVAGESILPLEACV